METSVVYLRHQIDSEGLHATADQVEVIVRAPISKNVQELRSFFGLLNYYWKFLVQFGLSAATSELTATAWMLLEMDS